MEGVKLALFFSIIALILIIFLFIWIWSCRDSFLSLGAFKVVDANFCSHPDSPHHANKDTLYEPANTLYNAFPKTPGNYVVLLHGSEDNICGRQLVVLNNGCTDSVIEVKADCGVKILPSLKDNLVPAGSSATYVILDINVFRRVS